MIGWITLLIVLTGGPGSGKSTLLEELKSRGVSCVDESGRRIIREQLACDGEILPWKNPQLFRDAMLQDAVETFQKAEGVTVFDRGIIDCLAYSYLADIDIPSDLIKAAENMRYTTVFITPPWKEIYCNDAERKQTFEEAIVTYEIIKKIYEECGYKVIEIPKTDVQSRADFVMSYINSK